MIKHLLLPIILLISFPCTADAFLSNALGQDLGSIESLTGSGYEGDRKDGVTTIYLDGSVIRERREGENGYTIEYGDTVETVTLGDDGERTEWRIETPDKKEVHTYFYTDGRLSSVSVSIDGELERRLVYLDTPSGALAGTTGSSDSYISPSFYLYELDGNSVKFTYHSNGLVTREDFSASPVDYEVEDDGSWVETETLPDGSEKERVYSSDGRLVSEKIGDSLTSYEYNDAGDMIKSHSINGSEEIVSSYEDGHLVSSETIIDGMTSRIRNYLDSGEIEEIRYRDGVPEYSILFDGDGVRVKEIHRL